MTAPVWLHVFATFGRGGPQVRAVQLMARAPEVRHVVLAMNGCTDAAEGVPDLELRDAPRGGTRANVKALAGLLHDLRPALLLTYNWGAIEAVWAARRTGLRALVHHEDGFGPEEVVRRFLRRNLARRWLLGRAAAVVVPSRVLLGIARREWGVRPSRLHHLPNGVDLQRFHPREQRSPGPLRIGTVGGLRSEKDHATLLRALALLPDRDCRLRIVGDGPLRHELVRLVDDLGLGRRVEFTGAVTDPAAAYRDLDVFVLSSTTEQMPLSLLEAMASGLPVAATDVGDVRAILPPDSRAGIVPPREPATLAHAITGLLGDAKRQRREGLANRAWCEQHYQLTACLDRYLGVYRAAVGRR